MRADPYAENSSEADLDKCSSLLNEVFSEEKVWRLAAHEDPFVRRAIYRLLIATLAKQKNLLNASMISSNMLTSGLHGKQAGSAFDFAKAIAMLSKEMPDVWTTYYTGSGKKSAQSRLIHFLRRGSQGGPPEFWLSVSSLLHNVPMSILAKPIEDGHSNQADDELQKYSPVLNALREGISSKDETRLNQGSAWTTYLDVFNLVQASLPTSDERQLFCKAALSPLFSQYIRPSTEHSTWTVSGPQQRNICLRACNLALSITPKPFEEEWHALSAKVVEDLKISQPEQSKDYARSQEAILAESDRWYQLHASMLDDVQGSAFAAIMKQTLPNEISSALTIIRGRNGKPYGAAAAVEKALLSVPLHLLTDTSTREMLLDFASNVIPELLFSPSAKYLIQILSSLEDQGDVSQAYEKCIRSLAESSDSAANSTALQTLVSSPHLRNTEKLDTIVMRKLHHALEHDDDHSWKLVMAAFKNPAAPQSLTYDMLVDMVGNLSIHADTPTGLRGLEMAAMQSGTILKDFALSPKGSSLLSALLSLSESGNETISQKAKTLSSLVERSMVANGGTGQATRSMLDMIHSGINTVGVDSLPYVIFVCGARFVCADHYYRVDVLVGQAQKMLDQASVDEMPDVAAQLLPDLAQWTTAIAPFSVVVPDSSLSITNPLGGAVSLISSTPSIPVQQPIARDEDGYSSVCRMAQYTTKLIKSTKAFDYITSEQKAAICRYLGIYLQLAGDNLSISESIPLWHFVDTDQEPEIINSVAETQNLVSSWLSVEPSIIEFVAAAQAQLLHAANGLTTASYYSARAYAATAIEMAELHSHKSDQSDVERLKALRKSPDVFASAAYLTSASESKELRRLCNELLADLTDYNFQGGKAEGLSTKCWKTHG